MTKNAPANAKIQLGIAGTGWISKLFAEAALESGQYEIVSVLATSIAKGEAFAESIEQTAQPFDDQHAFLASDADTIYIATPNSEHYPQALAVLKAGKNAIVEKPAVQTAEEWQTLVDTAKAKNVKVVEAFRHLWEPNYFTLRKAIHDIDNITGVSLNWKQFSSKFDQLKAGELPRVFDAAFAGGVLNDLGVYPLSWAIGMFGKPNAISYSSTDIRSEKSTSPDRVDLEGLIIMQYDAFVLRAAVSKIQNSANLNEVYDSTGNQIVFDEIAGVGSAQWYRGTEQIQGREIDLEPAADNMLLHEARAFAKLWRGEQAEWTLNELHAISAVVAAALESLHKKVA